MLVAYRTYFLVLVSDWFKLCMVVWFQDNTIMPFGYDFLNNMLKNQNNMLKNTVKTNKIACQWYQIQ